MKYFFLLIGLLLALQPVAAQESRPASPPDSPGVLLPTPPAESDTVAALHRLFVAKRRTRTYVLAGTVIAVVMVAIVVASQPEKHGGSGGGFALSNGPIFSSADQAGFVVGFLGVPLLTTELLVYGNFSRRNEAQALVDFRAHQLSKHIKRKLKAKHFCQNLTADFQPN
ncbi:hypothetical protein [Hymenobacter psoromatis]|uniref:hypothetical protein n=1 Tax=Hymenobacter psoromatis TaxID=1484116 RepID=UPI001CBD0499|nr:hypothetical protein [Hymenobacter psoromatis]